MESAQLRADITAGPIRPPQRLAPYSYALGLEVAHWETSVVPEHSEGDSFGRLILLYDPAGDEVWNGSMRLVTYIQADIEETLATDGLLSEVAWSWLTEGLDSRLAKHNSLGGTVTATTSHRFGDINGPKTAYQLEVRASWTPESVELADHVLAFSDMLANIAGLPPEGVSSIR